uniref:Uncharacterized protein n=1 Tax=Bacillus cereus TaxID=1396 RepID=Q20CJ5_BACCE|nr:hypothetical protein [Bacillus cereus]
MLLLFDIKLNNLNIRCRLLRKISTQHGKNVACFSKRVRNMGKVLHVLQERYARWKRCCVCNV